MATKRKPNEKDYITNKVLAVFSLCLAGVLGLMLLYRLVAYGSSYTVGMTTARVLMGLGILGVLWGAFRMVQEKKSAQDMRFRLVCGKSILYVCALILISMICVNFLGAQSIKAFYIILPAIAVYYLIFHSYPREFFIIALDCGAAAALLAVVHRALNSTSYQALAYVCVAAALVIAAVQVMLVLRAKKDGHYANVIDGKRELLFTSAHAYTMMLASAAAMVVLVALGAFLGAQIAYYMIFVAVAYLFVTAVYYTVKMM